MFDRPGLGRAARGRIKDHETKPGDRRDECDRSPRQPRKRPRDDGGGDHACLAGRGGNPLAERHAAVLRAIRSSSGPPMLSSNAPRVRERLLPVEEKQQGVADQRRCDGGAETAMLDDSARRVARVVVRNEAHEERVVAQLPIRSRVISALPGAQIVGLRSARLPAIWMPSMGEFGGRRCAMVDNPPHGLPNEIEMVLVDRELGLRHHRFTLEKPGNHTFPVASRLAIMASWSGLMSTMPWPIDMLIVS